jgi:hypothetical protein
MWHPQSLLDFSKEFDVGLLDKVVMAFYTGLGQEVCPVTSYHDPAKLILRFQQAMAQQVLTQFQDNPESWTRVPDILEKSSFPQAKVNQNLTRFSSSNVDLRITVHRSSNFREANPNKMENTPGRPAAR